MINIFLVMFGIFFMVMAIVVEIQHKTIWQRSLSHYKRPTSQLIHVLTRPSMTSYKLNRFFIWPLIFLIGIWCISEGFNYINLMPMK